MIVARSGDAKLISPEHGRRIARRPYSHGYLHESAY